MIGKYLMEDNENAIEIKLLNNIASFLVAINKDDADSKRLASSFSKRDDVV